MNERRFDTPTLGARLIASRGFRLLCSARMIVSYAFRWAEAPDLDSNAIANQILDALDDRVNSQGLTVF